MTYLLNCIRQKRLVKYGSVCYAYYIDRCLLPAGNELASKNSALDCKQTTLSSGNTSYFSTNNSFDFVFANGMHLIKSRIHVLQDVSAGNGSMVLRGLSRTWKNEDKIACTTDAGDTIYLQGLVGENAIRLYKDEAQVKAGTVINVNYVIAPQFFN